MLNNVILSEIEWNRNFQNFKLNERRETNKN